MNINTKYECLSWYGRGWEVYVKISLVVNYYAIDLAQFRSIRLCWSTTIYNLVGIWTLKWRLKKFVCRNNWFFSHFNEFGRKVRIASSIFKSPNSIDKNETSTPHYCVYCIYSLFWNWMYCELFPRIRFWKDNDRDAVLVSKKHARLEEDVFYCPVQEHFSACNIESPVLW